MSETWSAAAAGMYEMFIDGRWVAASDGGTLDVVDPATETKVARVACGGRADVEAAVVAARRAFDTGPWPRMSAADRAVVLRRASEKVRENADVLARLETLEVGKVLTESLADMAAVAFALDCAADLAARRWSERSHVGSPPVFGKLVREPVGVVAAITPWNFPLMLAACKFAYALATGNVVIVKPASITPLTTLEMARLFAEVGLPEGVYQVVVGPGGTVGDHLCASPLVDMVTFTGSLDVGRGVMRQAAGSVKKVGLELGGKSPNIVFADADLEAAVQGALFGAFRNAGQVCVAGSRLLVERGLYDRLLAEIVRRAESIAVGPGLEPGSTMGPLVSREQLDIVDGYVKIGLEEGARLVAGGRRLPGAGFFYAPTIFADVETGMRIAQEEIFGPVLAVIPFDTEAEAVAIANDTIFGLGCGVWTGDMARADRVMRAVRAGMVWVNTYNRAPGDAPWGGYKASGLGRERGEYGLDEFTEVKNVIYDMSGKPLGFYPAP